MINDDSQLYGPYRGNINAYGQRRSHGPQTQSTSSTSQAQGGNAELLKRLDYLEKELADAKNTIAKILACKFQGGAGVDLVGDVILGVTANLNLNPTGTVTCNEDDGTLDIQIDLN